MSLLPRSRLPHWGWLLLATVILIIGGTGLTIWVPYRHEQQMIQRINAWRGVVEVESVAPEWLQNLAGEERVKNTKIFERIRLAEVTGPGITDRDIAQFKSLRHLRRLSLHGTNLTDAGLAQLGALTQLRHLDISKTAVTDAGLAHLSRLKNLSGLDLHATAVTDAGLPQLSPLKHLGIVHLDLTHVTDIGVNSLKKALPDCHVVR